jgi:hypothetical protein
MSEFARIGTANWAEGAIKALLGVSGESIG